MATKKQEHEAEYQVTMTIVIVTEKQAKDTEYSVSMTTKT